MSAELVMSAAEITQDRDRWLAVRRGGITATDAATIMGVNPWDSPFALWHRKKGNLPEVPDSDRFRLARYLEDYCIERWEEATGNYGPHGQRGAFPAGLFRDGWRLATPDALVNEADVTGKPLGVLECKTVASWDGWGRGLGHAGEIRGQPSLPSGVQVAHAVNVVPAHVRVQVLWQCDVLGVPVGHVGALHQPSGEFRWYTIDVSEHTNHAKADQIGCEVCEIRARCADWYSHLTTNTPPPVDGAEATTAALKALHHVTKSERTAYLDRHLANRYLDLKPELDDLTAQMDEVKNLIRAAMGDAKYARWVDEEHEDRKLFTRTVSKVAGHWMAPFERDVLMPARRKKADDEA